MLNFEITKSSKLRAYFRAQLNFPPQNSKLAFESHHSSFISILCLSALLLVGFTTGSNKTTKVPIIDLTGDITNQKQILLSDIATDIQYVKLEGNKDCFIKQIQSSSITKDHILIVEEATNNILLFSIDGKFLRQISRFGKGPGEHGRRPQVSFDLKGTSIYVLYYKKLDLFDLNGKLTGTIRLDPSPQQEVDLGDNILLTFPYPESITNDNYHFTIIDKKGKLIKKIFSWDNYKNDAGNAIYITRLTWYRDTLLYKNKYSDTIYGITKDLNITPRWFIKQKTKQNPAVPEIPESGFFPGPFQETPYYFFNVGTFNNFMHPLMINKKTHEITFVPYNKDIMRCGLVNDLDGGDLFWPERYMNGKSYRFDYPTHLKDQVEKILERKIKVKYPDKKQKLIEFIKGISEDDNQVLTIVTLKS